MDGNGTGRKGNEQQISLQIAGLPVYRYGEHPELKFTPFQSNTKKKKYTKEFITFDIETTTLSKDINFMYIWQMCYNGEYCVYGRTWEDFKALVTEIQRAIIPPYNVICYIHNLSYEFQYLRGIFDFQKEDVFVMDSRRILKANIPGIEFRCSYYLSNMSLSQWGKKLEVTHIKLSGEEFDYSKIRYPWSILTNEEMAYCIYDVITLYECVKKTMELDKDTLYTIPLTSTGYVRRDAKKALQIKRKDIKQILPDKQVMLLLREAFRGGNSHANRWYTGKILNNVLSYDRQSSYPDNMINDVFPMKPFRPIEPTLLNIRKLLKNKKPFLVKLELTDIDLKNIFWGFPYIPIAKCRHLRNVKKDNGRVLQADYLEITLTDIDYKIIAEEYNFNILKIDMLYYSEYGNLPAKLKDVILKYYVLKTQLKGVKGQEVYYTKSKNKLNATYGMLVQNPLKDTILYDNGEYVIDDEKTIEVLMEEYHKKGFLAYQWGVWVTAWSRYRLEEGLKLAGESAVYCDTDSVKSISPIDFTEFNNVRIDRDLVNDGMAIDRKENIQYLGIFDYEGKYDKFVTLGAKKYCYEINGELFVTIAGVGKIKGAKELKQNGGIASFQPGFVFRLAGGQEWTYNDEPTHNIIIDGQKIIVTPNISAIPSTYTVSLSPDYAQLLDDILEYENYRKAIDIIP